MEWNIKNNNEIYNNTLCAAFCDDCVDILLNRVRTAAICLETGDAYTSYKDNNVFAYTDIKLI